ncbi:hypothetical protein [Paraburkholderia sp. CI3]|uniref:hypothetical protein n=1 Tax=Paraburkholderia sp. CI3 TaxID=2991060 RepID=UPI003D1A390F
MSATKLFRVADLRRALKGVPDDAFVMVRIEHDGSYTPGEEGWEPVWGEVFHWAEDNTLNIA